jgi:hypothetical protein
MSTSPNKSSKNQNKPDKIDNLIKDDFKIENNMHRINLNAEDIVTLKEIIKEHRSRSNNKPVENNLIKILTNKSARIKTIVNLETELKDHLKKFSEENNINVSDSINYILSNYFK